MLDTSLNAESAIEVYEMPSLAFLIATAAIRASARSLSATARPAESSLALFILWPEESFSKVEDSCVEARPRLLIE